MKTKSRTWKTPKQESFANIKFKGSLAFGGSHLKNSHAKTERPFCSKSAMHLVLKSSVARHELSFLHFDKKIRQRIHQQALRWNVKVYSFANAGNHLHLLIRSLNRKGFRGFLRAIASLITRDVLGAERSSASEFAGKFWDQRPYSRIVRSWTKDFKNVKSYLCLNRLEGEGFFRRALDYGQRRRLTAWLRTELWPSGG